VSTLQLNCPPEARAPTGRLVDAGVEDGVVDDGIGADKEVGEEAGDLEAQFNRFSMVFSRNF